MDIYIYVIVILVISNIYDNIVTIITSIVYLLFLYI